MMSYKSLGLGLCLFLSMIAVSFVVRAVNTDFSADEIAKWQTTLFPNAFETPFPDSSFRFEKNARADAFQVLKNEENTIGVAQDYKNSVCFVRISYFYPNMGRLSNTKLRRYLKEKAPFQITHQNSVEINKKRYHYIISSHADQTDVLLISRVENNMIQIRETCQTLPALSQKENRRLSLDWAKIIAEKFSAVKGE